jgi:hypothetical protein
LKNKKEKRQVLPYILKNSDMKSFMFTSDQFKNINKEGPLADPNKITCLNFNKHEKNGIQYVQISSRMQILLFSVTNNK